MERTLSIIKPDAVARNLIGQILERFEKAGLKIIGAKMVRLTKERAQAFYSVHQAKPFYEELTSYMSSGPILVQVLEGPNAIALNRQIMGATNPQKAEKGTIRADFALSLDKNSVHGSDAPETAQEEIAFFFSQEELFSR
ncbi:MAG: nucleoside-diphosphate kinase [Parachlamydiales bacterium]|jgi:nucleoside-diphosphate kinase